MDKGYLLLFNGISETLIQLKMLEASLMILQRRAEELWIEEAEDQ